MTEAIRAVMEAIFQEKQKQRPKTLAPINGRLVPTTSPSRVPMTPGSVVRG